jgi:phage host-nuclease inhibitor protein Gam
MTENAVDSVPSAGAVGRRIGRIAAVEMRLAALQAELDQALDAVRRRYDSRACVLRRRLACLTGELESFCRAHRSTILPPGHKTLATPFGEVGFRKADATVALAHGMTADEVCVRLRRARLSRLVRVSYALDRPAIRRAFADGRAAADRLARCGIALEQPPDSFRYKVRREPAAVGASGEGGER